jgi:erythromycin esterase-like protein
VREKYGPASVAVGFGTHHGTVTAARAWDEPPRFMAVPPAREGSYEHAFHRLGAPAFYLPLARIAAEDPAGAWLRETRGERAIGVVYDPARERYGNYVPTRLAARYDAYLYFDATLAVEPLDGGEAVPGLEAFPTGL